MTLLIKNICDVENPRNDNSDKKKLFPDGGHTEAAKPIQERWVFIHEDDIVRNVSYQLQYIEFLTRLYNEYQIYLTYESLLCKNIMVAVCAVAEASLFSVIGSLREKGGMIGDWRTDFTSLLGQAYHDYKLIDRDLWHYFHDLRKLRNTVHIHAADFREYNEYNVERANKAIEMLESLRVQLTSTV